MNKNRSGYRFKEVEKFNCMNSEGERRRYTVVTLKYVIVPLRGMPLTFAETKTFESKEGSSEICIRRRIHSKEIKHKELQIQHKVAILNVKYNCIRYYELN